MIKQRLIDIDAHAFLGWFDCSFPTPSGKPVRFSTGPHAKYTHWKQTVFYTKNVISLYEGQQINGWISVKPNDRNPRDLDIIIHYETQEQNVQSETVDFKMS